MEVTKKSSPTRNLRYGCGGADKVAKLITFQGGLDVLKRGPLYQGLNVQADPANWARA